VANPEQTDQWTGAGAADLETNTVPVRDWSCSSAPWTARQGKFGCCSTVRLSATADGIILSLRMVNVLVSWWCGRRIAHVWWAVCLLGNGTACVLGKNIVHAFVMETVCFLWGRNLNCDYYLHEFSASNFKMWEVTWSVI